VSQTFSTIAQNASEAAYPHLWRGLVGAWAPFLGVTGGTLRDMSGRDNHGTLTNMDPATDWQVSGGWWCLDLDGVNDCITLQPGQLPLGASPRTVHVNFRMNSDADAAMINWGGNGGGGTRWNMWRAKTPAGGQKIGVECLNAYKLVNWNFDTDWHDFTATLSSSTLNSCRIYFDGEEPAITASVSTGVTLNTLSSDCVIGRLSGTSIQHFPGKISQILVYNRALSAAEVKQIHSNPGGVLARKRRRVYSIPAGVIVYGQRLPRHRTILGGGLR